MSNSINMEVSYPKEVERAKKEHWPVLIPVGTMEYHSTHCPFGCDALIAKGLAEEIAKKKDCLLLPPVWYGVASYAVGGPETNTINVNVDVFESYIYNILKSLFQSGFTRNICLILAHQTEEFLPMTLACMKAAKKVTFEYLDETKGYGWWGKNENAEFYQNLTATENPWNWIRVFNGARFPSEVPIPGDHAGKYECSALEALYPGSIKLERLDDADDWFAQDSREMSVELGKWKVENQVANIIEAIETGIRRY